MDPVLNQRDQRSLDELEEEMARAPQAECPVTHHFTPGLYIRTILIPAGTLLTSAQHRTEHPFVITRGRIRVGSGSEGDVIYEAPHMGITKPGTRRLLYALEDTVWTTFHVTEETDPARIGEKIIEPGGNPGLPEGFRPGWEETSKRLA